MGTLDSIPSLAKDDSSNPSDPQHQPIAGQYLLQGRLAGPPMGPGMLPQHAVSNPLSTGTSLETKQSKCSFIRNDTVFLINLELFRLHYLRICKKYTKY